MFLLISSSKTVHQYGVSIQSFTKVRETSANNSETVGHKDQRLGQIVEK